MSTEVEQDRNLPNYVGIERFIWNHRVLIKPRMTVPDEIYDQFDYIINEMLGENKDERITAKEAL